MDVKNAIESRRSIRKYLDKEVSRNLILELVEAARLAPSGNNAQPWKFFIVQDENMKKKLDKENCFVQDFVCSTPVIIVCCGDPGSYKKKVEGVDDENKIRAIRDLSLACQNIVLLATELGLGTCYIGWRDEAKIKKILSIPEDYVLPYVITLGYPDENPVARSRKEIDDILLNKII